ncbi:MAG: DNA repair protein RecN [Bacteroidales bacterium]|jgi:DNA repair protein RecN (Recombination protein N)|nr:DNA repair protein RecN [Bacteroidales bacterium]
MLKTLHISNYALIDNLEAEFYPGFSVVTGETGAGKSIILGAFSLILGQRADAQVLTDKKRKCIIEAIFFVEKGFAADFFTFQGLDFDTTLILRREINPEGKSRSFINDTPASLAQLKELGDKLVDVHSQHQTRMINTMDFQMLAIDDYAGISDKVRKHAEEFAASNEIKNELVRLMDLEQKSKNEADFFNFLYNELEQSALKENEQPSLEQELEMLNNVELIKSTLTKTLYALNQEENNILQQLVNIQQQIASLSKFDISLEENSKRMQSLNIELKDIVSELEHTEGKIFFNPERLETVSQRLSEIYRLQQKHKVSSVKELIDIKNELDSKLQHIASLEGDIEKLKKKITSKENELQKSAEKISSARKAVFPEIEQKLVNMLQMLGIPNARIKIQCIQSGFMKENGLDEISFTFSANKGSELKEFERIASGGEQSRLMLAIKSLISRKKLLPTIIFDEIDSGVSGEIASKTGSIMKELSKDMQVIAITHLPQIAGKSDYHYQVFKTEDEKSTFTHMKVLTKEERIDVLATMLSGNKITDASIKTAKQLLH